MTFNPLQREGDAFKVLIAVLVLFAVIIALAKLL